MTDERAPPVDVAITTRESNREGARRVLVATKSGIAVHPLPASASLVFGRGVESDVQVADESVSRRHARVDVDGSVTIADLGSRNGTRVAGRRLTSGERVVVAVGTVIELGDVLVTIVDSSTDTARAPRERRDGPIVADPKMQRVYALLDAIAPSSIAVLVLGETGTGKEVFAAEVHARSGRAKGPMVCLNCAALPESLLEAELFGHEQGAFTGATSAKAGLFEAADGGTVFLDELGDMHALTQAKLLRVLESGEVMRIGSRKPRHVDVRVVSATNKDLAAKIADGSFRADLFYRLAGFSVTLPPLRERPSDIEALALAFARRTADKSGQTAVFTAEALTALRGYTFPGNVRELKTIVERAAVLARGEPIGVAALGLVSEAPPPPPQPAEAGDDGERARIVRVLAECAGNQRLAADKLGISRTTLVRRLDAFGLGRPRKGR